MAGKPIGTIYAELDLDISKYTAAQKKILYDSQTLAINQENSWKVLGQKSDVMYTAMRKQAENAYEGIKSRATSSAAEIVRAEEAKNAKIKSLNEQQFGHQTSLLESLKKNWMAVSAGIVAGYMAIQKAYSFGKDIASATNEIKRNAEITGLSTDEYQKWSYAAKMADVNAEELSKGFRLLSRNMSDTAQGTGEAKNAFAAMQISVNQLGGGLKPLDVMMREIMDKFAGWADGPQKIALALAIFGRSGETLIPLLNKGSRGFEELAVEAQKLGIILDPSVITAGSRAEDSFKRLEAQLRNTKLALAPLVAGFAEVIEPIGAFIALIGAGIKKIQDFSDTIEKWKYRTGLGSKSYEKMIDKAEMLRENPYLKWQPEKPAAPGLPSTEAEMLKAIGLEFHSLKARQEFINKANAEEIERKQATMVEIYGIEQKYYSESEALKDLSFKTDYEAGEWAKDKTIEAEREMLRIKTEANTAVIASDEMVYEIEERRISLMTSLKGRYASLIGDIQLQIEAEREETEQTIKRLNLYDKEAEAMRKVSEEHLKPLTGTGGEGFIAGLKKYADEVGTVYQQMATAARSVTTGMENAFSNFFQSITDKSKSWSDKMKGLFQSLGQSIIKTLSDIAAKWLVTQAIKGIGSAISGIGGLLGLLEGGTTGPLLEHYPIRSYATGGIANTPQLGIFGEGGGRGEAFVPLDSGGKIPVQFTGEKKDQQGIQSANIFQIICMDPISWRDFVRRNPEAIIEAISKDARGAGAMRGTIKGVG